MISRITRVGELAEPVLNGAFGSVLAVFKSSVYLEVSDTDELLCLGTQTLIDGPINVSTSVVQLPAIQAEQQWCCREGKLCIEGAASFQYSANQLTHTATKELLFSSPVDPQITELLHTQLKLQNTQTAFNQSLEDRLQTGIKTLSQWLQSEPGLPPAEQLQDIIGCGEGLTPAGDDILIGALIALKHTDRMEQFKVLSEWIKAHAATLTNRISLAHLHAACKGHAVILLHNVLNAIGSKDATIVQQTLTKLNQYGHSSGEDALRGVLAVIDTSAVYQTNATHESANQSA